MQEYRDGSFGQVEPARQLLRRLAKDGLPQDLKAVHFGARQALARMRLKAEEGRTEGSRGKARRKVAELEERVRELEARLNLATAGGLQAEKIPHDSDRAIRVYPAEALDRLPRR